MKKPKFRPIIRKDGNLDLECFQRAGTRFVKDWLRERLSNRDPYFPIDKRSAEDPEALVVGLIRDGGTQHPSTRLIARAVKELLTESRSLAPTLPGYFRSLLRLCQQVPLPETSSWFVEELRLLVENPVKTESNWGANEIFDGILDAAIVQAPGLPQSASYLLWKELLTRPQYCTAALLALGSSFELRLAHMRAWWRNCPLDERETELRQIVYEGVRTEGKENVRAMLLSARQLLPDDLQRALDETLRLLGIAVVFDAPQLRRTFEGGHICAIRNAGLRREHVLPELQLS